MRAPRLQIFPGSLHPPLALVGHGIWGRVILRELRSLGRAVWVVEPEEAARREAAASADGAVAALEELPPGIAGWIIATPAVTHEAVGLAVLERGGPVLCEKPLAADLASARRLATAGAGRLFVGHIWCYHPGVEMLAGIARSGELGPVSLLRTWRANWTSPRRDVDSVWNLAPHDVALAQFILGELPRPVAAFAEHHEGRCVGLLGVLGDGPRAIFEVSNRYREKRREIRLHCRGGVAVLPDADSPALEITRSDAAARPVLETRPIPLESALRRELAAFCAHVDGGPPPLTPAADGVAVVEAIVALRRLAGLDAPVSAP